MDEMAPWILPQNAIPDNWVSPLNSYIILMLICVHLGDIANTS